MSEKEEKPICADPMFAAILAHATQMSAHILDEVGEDQEALENSNVTLGCDFVLDCLDLIQEYALRYEGEHFADIHEELIMMYQQQAKRKAGFGSKVVH